MGVVGPYRHPSRFDVFLVALDPTVGHEIRKTRPCVVVSPDELNHALQTVIVAPMTTARHAYPWRPPVTFARKRGRVVLDQLRTVDRERLGRRLGALDPSAAREVLDLLAELFAP
jgi:mRNA interferase MazF